MAPKRAAAAAAAAAVAASTAPQPEPEPDTPAAVPPTPSGRKRKGAEVKEEQGEAAAAAAPTATTSKRAKVAAEYLKWPMCTTKDGPSCRRPVASKPPKGLRDLFAHPPNWFQPCADANCPSRRFAADQLFDLTLGEPRSRDMVDGAFDESLSEYSTEELMLYGERLEEAGLRARVIPVNSDGETDDDGDGSDDAGEGEDEDGDDAGDAE